jgi:AraC-like DNA-binding protein/quercetin dioxygenase-like cupin family protein
MLNFRIMKRPDSIELDRLNKPLALRIERWHVPAGYSSDEHSHPDAQLIYPCRGVMLLATREGVWSVPPTRACWLPAGESHQVRATPGFEMLSIYCTGPVLRRLPVDVGIVPIPPLLRELILQLERTPSAIETAHLAEVFADHVRCEPRPHLFVPPLNDKRLKPIELALKHDVADTRTLADWAAHSGVAPRTLARVFQQEAGMSFVAYRTQARLVAATRRLAEAQPVTRIALELGFSSASRFIDVFRQATGTTPKKFFAQSKRRKSMN